MSGTPADARAAAIAAQLEPYAWRSLTGVMLARRAVGALDHHGVLSFVAGQPGALAGPPHPVDTADRSDPRVDALVRLLQGRRWRESSLDRLCIELVVALDAWLAGRLSASGWAPDDR